MNLGDHSNHSRLHPLDFSCRKIDSGSPSYKEGKQTSSQVHSKGDASVRLRQLCSLCSIPCRSVVIDSLSRTAVHELLADADIQLKAHMAHFLLVCLHLAH